jgi:hypothetical protein
MSSTQLGIVAIALLVILGVLVLIYALWVRGRTEDESQEMPDSLKALRDARIDPGEKVATPLSEEIESLVQAELKAHPDLADRQIDFASAPDGSLAIWVDGVAYHEVADIPDERIRQAVRSAVDSFNQSAPG